MAGNYIDIKKMSVADRSLFTKPFVGHYGFDQEKNNKLEQLKADLFKLCLLCASPMWGKMTVFSKRPSGVQKIYNLLREENNYKNTELILLTYLTVAIIAESRLQKSSNSRSKTTTKFYESILGLYFGKEEKRKEGAHTLDRLSSAYSWIKKFPPTNITGNTKQMMIDLREEVSGDSWNLEGTSGKCPDGIIEIREMLKNINIYRHGDLLKAVINIAQKRINKQRNPLFRLFLHRSDKTNELYHRIVYNPESFIKDDINLANSNTAKVT